MMPMRATYSEDIIHYAAVHLRVVGSGNLLLTFINLDNTRQQQLAPTVMSNTPGIEPRRLANFQGQRVKLKIGTTNINETFIINRIIIFSKTLWSEYPG